MFVCYSEEIFKKIWSRMMLTLNFWMLQILIVMQIRWRSAINGCQMGIKRVLDLQFKQFAVHLCGLSRGEDYLWGVVKDAALSHRKFESGHDEITCTAPKRPKTVFFSAFHQFIADGS